MPVPHAKIEKWLNHPDTLRLVYELSQQPNDGSPARRLAELRLLRHGAPVLAIPKGMVPLAKDRERALLWIVNLVNTALEQQLQHQNISPQDHDPILPHIPQTPEA